MSFFSMAFQGSHNFDDTVVDVKTVNSVEAPGEKLCRSLGRQAGGKSHNDNVRSFHTVQEVIKAREIGHTAQVVGCRSDGCRTANNADAGRIGALFKRADDAASYIAKSQNSSCKGHGNSYIKNLWVQRKKAAAAMRHGLVPYGQHSIKV